jgi:hypothetical protein
MDHRERLARLVYEVLDEGQFDPWDRAVKAREALSPDLGLSGNQKRAFRVVDALVAAGALKLQARDGG